MTFKITELLEHEKFIQSHLNKKISDLKKKRKITGTFKIVGEKEEMSGDEFMAYEISGGDALESYKCYIAYFNHTLQEHEKPREAIKANWIEEEVYK